MKYFGDVETANIIIILIKCSENFMPIITSPLKIDHSVLNVCSKYLQIEISNAKEIFCIKS